MLFRLQNNWLIQSTEQVEETGTGISQETFNSTGWYSAQVPGTVLGILVDNGQYPNHFEGKNFENISPEPFEKSWWFRTNFHLEAAQASKNALLSFDGINYKANIWLNGNLIAGTDTAEGTFRRFRFDISEKILHGQNILAVEVFPPQPGQFSIGFVDWNHKVPDSNMGLFRPVSLDIFDVVHIYNPFIETKVDLKSLQFADLQVSAELRNYSHSEVNGILKGRIGTIEFEKKVSLSANRQDKVTFGIDDFPSLQIQNPKLWWPNNLGKANLYQLELEFISNNTLHDKLTQSFGIRSVDDYLTEEGHRGFIINGKKTLIKGAGWTDNIFLNDTPESIKSQIQYVKHMNLNCIRLEGFWGKDHTLYDLCDRYGILIMAGWSCHWEHELHLGKPIHPRYGGVTEPDEIVLIAQSWEDQVTWLRNHPSIFVWSVGSDMVPHPDLERKYFETFKKYDSARPYLNSTGGVGSDQGVITETEVISDLTGSSGVKMLGPYDYTPPIYWYENKNLGGAYGFNSETCPGGNVPPLDSIRKMIPENHLWPIDEVWDYHCALYEFGTLSRFKEALDKRYGESKNVEEFAAKAQMLNYELMRPMFEAFQANKGNATGIIQWMLNSAWPALYWQLYDHYLIPNGAFYGTRKACEPLHLLYNYGDNHIYFINDTFNKIKNFKAVIRLFDIESKEVFSRELAIKAEAESSTKIFELPEIEGLSTTSFLDLRLFNNDEQKIGNNFYWLSGKADILDYEYKFKDFAFYTPSKEYADFTQINSMPKVSINTNVQFDDNGKNREVSISLENSNEYIAFFIELNIHNKKRAETVVPVLWDDNYISLLPGEIRKIKAEIPGVKFSADDLQIKIQGWNSNTKLNEME